jgi:hypothetical protein
MYESSPKEIQRGHCSAISSVDMSALSISPGASPFPFAALATAAYINATIKFEDTPGDVALQGGPATSNELEIVSFLAKSAQVHANDAKVCRTRRCAS